MRVKYADSTVTQQQRGLQLNWGGLQCMLLAWRLAGSGAHATVLMAAKHCNRHTWRPWLGGGSGGRQQEAYERPQGGVRAQLLQADIQLP